MKKILFCMAEYNDERQDFFINFTSKRNKEYCHKNGFEYLELLKLPRENDGQFWRSNPTWLKHKIVRDMINDKTVSDGDIISHIDADMAIVKNLPMETSKSFGYAIDSCNTHCMGYYTLKVNEWSRTMINKLLDEELYKRMKNNISPPHKNLITGGPNWEIFREQAAWYTLTGIITHSWKSFLDLPNFGFHSAKSSETIYSLKELNNHVEIFQPEWNVTHINEEDGYNNFYINPTKKEDTIIRHFAAGRKWRKEYFV